MARVRENFEIVNNGDKPYKEMFRGKEIVIPAKGSIVMERREAVNFVGQYIPFDKEHSIGEKPLSMKPARGKAPSAPVAVLDDEPEHVHPVTGKEYATKEALDEDLKGFEHLALKDEKDEK